MSLRCKFVHVNQSSKPFGAAVCAAKAMRDFNNEKSWRAFTRQPDESLGGGGRVDPIECLFQHPGQHQQIGAAVALRLLPLLPVLV